MDALGTAWRPYIGADETERPRYTTFAQSSEREHDDLASMHNCIRLDGLTFRAELAEGGAERLELMRT